MDILLSAQRQTTCPQQPFLISNSYSIRFVALELDGNVRFCCILFDDYLKDK